MQYLDKSSGRMVKLTESSTDYLVVTEPNQGEAVNSLLGQHLFTVSRGSEDDGVYLLRAKTDGESLVELQKHIRELQRDDAVKAVVPALMDPTGALRFALPDRVTVQFTGDEGEWEALLERLGAEEVRRFRSPGLVEVAAPPGTSVSALIGALNASRLVTFAEPSYYGVDDLELRVTTSRVTTSRPAQARRSAARAAAALDEESLDPTPGADGAWNVIKVRAPQAWRYTRGRPDIVVCVVDGMPDVGHEALRGKMLVDVDDSLVFCQDRSVSSHATNVCSVIAGESDRVTGIAPDVRLVPLVVNLRGQVYAERADALHMAARIARESRVQGPAGDVRCTRVVCSCSWRTSADLAVIRSAVAAAVAADVFVVFSAGNEDSSAPHFPSDYAGTAPTADGVVSVAATNDDDARSSFSNFSPRVSLAAPGGDGMPLDERDILCADQAESYVYAAGTSIAAPHVAAVAALALSVRPQLTLAELKAALIAGCDPVAAEDADEARQMGAGRVNAERVLEAVLSNSAHPDDPAPVVPEEPATEPAPDPGPAPLSWSPLPSLPADPASATLSEELDALVAQLQTATGWSAASIVLTRDGDFCVYTPD